MQDIQDQTGVLVRPVEKTHSRQVPVQMFAQRVQVIQATRIQHRRPRLRVSATQDTVAPMVVLVRRVRPISTRPGLGRRRVMIVTGMPIRQLVVHSTPIVHVIQATSETDTQRAPSAGWVRMSKAIFVKHVLKIQMPTWVALPPQTACVRLGTKDRQVDPV